MYSGCGIAGVVTYDGVGPADVAVTRMLGMLTHRGPNGEGLWHRPGVTLGHRRLSIVDLDDRAAQPMTREHLTVTYNGELYNHRQLRRELEGRYRFETECDTEVVLIAWLAWGEAALERMNGMYAFAVWDDRQRALHLVRDRIGVKPLYYYRGPDMLAFASEVEALLASELVPREPDLDALSHQLLCSSTLDVGTDRTLVGDVRHLPPATVMKFDATGSVTTRAYWRLPESDAGEPPRTSEDLAALLRDSVAGMLMGDVPIGTFLSGGLDSSAITAFAAEVKPITAVTVAYGEPGSAQPSAEGNADLEYSRLLARRRGDRIDHKVRVQAGAITLDDVDAVCDMAVLGDDVRHVNILGNYRAVRDLGLRGVLNGQGADEIMAGYVGRPNFIATVLDVRCPRPETITALPGVRTPAALSGDMLQRRASAYAAVLDHHAALPGCLLERAHRLLYDGQLRRVLQFEDFLSMRMSIEARVPFLDHRIVEWCFRGSFHEHVHPHARKGKVLLSQALMGVVPEAVRQRAKQVFPFPDRARLHRELVALLHCHEVEIRADSLIEQMFTLPPRESLGALPMDTVWLVLWIWRWHQRLTASAPLARAGVVS